jgi:N-acyl-L-homoserine lactone synthetase
MSNLKKKNYFVAIDKFRVIATKDVVAIDSFDRRATTYVVAIDLTNFYHS